MRVQRYCKGNKYGPLRDDLGVFCLSCDVAKLEKELAAVTRERDEATGGPFGDSVADLRVAIREARMHVLRQLNGRHEQDREDAKAWLEKWGK